MSEVNMEFAKTVYDGICSTLDNMGLKYQKIEDKLAITLGHKGDDMNHDLAILVDAKREAIQIWEKLPFSVDPAKSAEIASAVCLVNSRLFAGGFTYDLGERLTYEVTQFYAGSLIGESTIRSMIMALVFSVEEYDDKFMALNKGYLKVDDFKEE